MDLTLNLNYDTLQTMNNKEITMTQNIWEQTETIRLLKGEPGNQYQESSDADKKNMAVWVNKLLLGGKVTAEFIKADGTVRAMLCTLNPDLIPKAGDSVVKESKSTTSSERQPDPVVVKVYDLEIGGWRSFRLDRLNRITVEI